MDLIQAVILGAVQGLSEFLPISSSGHLVLCQHLWGFKQADVIFNISVHVGTLCAVMFFFHADISKLIKTMLKAVLALCQRDFVFFQDNREIKLLLLLIIGSIPTAVIGLLLKPMMEQIFSSTILVSVCLLITGTILWWTKFLTSSHGDFSYRVAFLIGLVQGLAILPGISRSGTTIACGLYLGLNRAEAARYSFLLSIPAILGAEILSLKDIGFQLPDIPTLLGTLTAGLVGLVALSALVFLVQKGRLYYFAPYCWIIGILGLIFL